jgi:hypothetical protein
MNLVVVTPAKLASSSAAAHASPHIRKSVYSPDRGRRIHHRRGISGANESDDPSVAPMIPTQARALFRHHARYEP